MNDVIILPESQLNEIKELLTLMTVQHEKMLSLFNKIVSVTPEYARNQEQSNLTYLNGNRFTEQLKITCISQEIDNEEQKKIFILTDTKTRHVPVDFVINCIKESGYNFLKLYLYLNVKYSGKVKRKKIDIKDIQETLGIKSRKTINTTLKELQMKNWVGFNPESDYYFIRGFDKIRAINCMNYKSAIIFNPEYFKIFRAWCASGLYAFEYKVIKRSKYDKSASKIEKANQACRATPPYLPISVNRVAKRYSISVAKASKLKKLARFEGLILVKRNFSAIDIDEKNLNLFKKYGDPNVAKRVRKRKEGVVIQETDLILPKFSLSKRKKLKTL